MKTAKKKLHTFSIFAVFICTLFQIFRRSDRLFRFRCFFTVFDAVFHCFSYQKCAKSSGDPSRMVPRSLVTLKRHPSRAPRSLGTPQKGAKEPGDPQMAPQQGPKEPGDLQTAPELEPKWGPGADNWMLWLSNDFCVHFGRHVIVLAIIFNGFAMVLAGVFGFFDFICFSYGLSSEAAISVNSNNDSNSCLLYTSPSPRD